MSNEIKNKNTTIKKKQYHTVRTVQKYNRKIAERGKIDTLSTVLFLSATLSILAISYAWQSYCR